MNTLLKECLIGTAQGAAIGLALFGLVYSSLSLAWHASCLRNSAARRFPESIRRGYTMATAKKVERPVIVTTEHRGVFFGYATETTGATIDLKRARMAIAFGTTRGLMELAETGPTQRSKISARADLEIRKVTAVFAVTDAAAAKWEAAP